MIGVRGLGIHDEPMTAPVPVPVPVPTPTPDSVLVLGLCVVTTVHAVTPS